MEKEKHPKAPSGFDHWVEMNSFMTRQKYQSIASYGLIFILGLCVVFLSFKDPVVAVLDDEGSMFLDSKRMSVPVGKADVEKVVNEFIKARYSWDSLNENLIRDRIKPLTTEGAAKKIYKEVKEEAKALEGKKVSQHLADIKVDIADDAIVAKFYRVMVILGTPIAIDTTASFQLIHGSRTKWNPAGLYVNGIIEHQVKSE